MSTKQSFGLVVLHFASYANVLMSGHAVLPRTLFVLPGLHNRLRRRLCCVKFMTCLFSFLLQDPLNQSSGLLANYLYLRGMLRIARGQNIEVLIIRATEKAKVILIISIPFCNML